MITSCVVAVIADTFFVFYAKGKGHNNLFLIAGLILTNIAALVWAYSMKKGIESAVAITFYALLTVAACTAVGVILFKEPLSPINAFGIILALVALFLIGL